MERSNNLGIPDLLLVAFVVLKLCGVIDWSWWWVLAPGWIPVAIVVGLNTLEKIIDKFSK